MITSKFKAGGVYGADDVNDTLKLLASTGVFNTVNLNDMVGQYANSGVISASQDLKVSLGADNTVVVGEGSCIMNDGSTLTVVGSEILTYDKSVSAKYYVYAYNNPVTNANELKCTSDMPTGDYVLLATISNNAATGATLEDNRVMSVSKVRNDLSPSMAYMTIDFEIPEDYTERIYTKTFTISVSGKCTLCFPPTAIMPQTGASLPNYSVLYGSMWVKIEDNNIVSTYCSGNNYSHTDTNQWSIYLFSNYKYIRGTLNYSNGVLSLTITKEWSGGMVTGKHSIPLYIYQE